LNLCLWKGNHSLRPLQRYHGLCISSTASNTSLLSSLCRRTVCHDGFPMIFTFHCRSFDSLRRFSITDPLCVSLHTSITRTHESPAIIVAFILPEDPLIVDDQLYASTCSSSFIIIHHHLIVSIICITHHTSLSSPCPSLAVRH